MKNFRKALKPALLAMLVVACMGAIFFFSSQNGFVSNGDSKGILKRIAELFLRVLGRRASVSHINAFVDSLNYWARKTMHWSVYFLLGTTACVFLRKMKIKRPLLLAVLFCAAYACSDEIHQMFTPERTPLVTDVLIDTCGAFFGAAIVTFASGGFKARVGKKPSKSE